MKKITKEQSEQAITKLMSEHDIIALSIVDLNKELVVYDRFHKNEDGYYNMFVMHDMGIHERDKEYVFRRLVTAYGDKQATIEYAEKRCWKEYK